LLRLLTSVRGTLSPSTAVQHCARFLRVKRKYLRGRPPYAPTASIWSTYGRHMRRWVTKQRGESWANPGCGPM